MDAVAMLTILLPIRMVDSSRSYFSSRRHASAAFLLPFSAIARRRVVLAEEKAVSVAEK